MVTFQNPGPPMPDGKGGYTQTWTDTTPATWAVSIEPASLQDIERLAVSGSVIAMASSVVKGDYFAAVTTATRMVHEDGRVFAIVGLRNVDERSILMELLTVERLPPGTV
jgi:head-tail adaptor